jgi:hypothetical protein
MKIVMPSKVEVPERGAETTKAQQKQSETRELSTEIYTKKLNQEPRCPMPDARCSVLMLGVSMLLLLYMSLISHNPGL